MRYLPGLKRLFSSARDDKLMIWHAAPDGRKKDGKLRQPADPDSGKPLILTILSSPMIQEM
jgi:hypothetical protein